MTYPELRPTQNDIAKEKVVARLVEQVKLQSQETKPVNSGASFERPDGVSRPMQDKTPDTQSRQDSLRIPRNHAMISPGDSNVPLKEYKRRRK